MKTLPRAVAGWALDSGAFTELSMNGKWITTPAEYIQMVQRFSDNIGKLEFAAPQDWMCEPFILSKTGYTVLIHQQLTVMNFLELKSKAPQLPWIPVLQGWNLADYQRHVESYKTSGVILNELPLVGLGSVCRRQSTTEVATIVSMLYKQGIRLHGFGIKLKGIAMIGKQLQSSDSLAWSFSGRRLGRRWCASGTHKNCANCLEYALFWREQILKSITKNKLSIS
jgi:hypothetical protein